MYFRRFYDERLAQASYLVGCQAKGVALVVDPARDIGPYLDTAAAEGLQIVAVTETHIHADFVSGSRELAAATGARMYLSSCGPPEWQYGFRTDPQVTLLADGDPIIIGNVTVRAVHTPGHTPEHLSFLVTDGAASTEAMGIVTGDFVFVGDVGRPDLLEKAAGIDNTALAGARQLWRSLLWFKTLPDHLQVWPGHGAGSACGKSLGAVPSSTVGYERRVNWALSMATEAEFVASVLAGQPEPPKYFGRMKQVNRDGPPILGAVPTPRLMPAAEIVQLIDRGAVVVDRRPTIEFAAAHIPGSLNIPASKSFSTYAGSLLPYDAALWFVDADPNPTSLRQLALSLNAIGFDRIAGVFDATAYQAWKAAGRSMASTEQLPVADLKAGVRGRLVVDVRNTSEWEEGHLPDATLIPLPELMARLDEIPVDREVVIHCQGGGRSAIAASVLKRAGRQRVANLTGGFAAWVAAGGAVER